MRGRGSAVGHASRLVLVDVGEAEVVVVQPHDRAVLPTGRGGRARRDDPAGAQRVYRGQRNARVRQPLGGHGRVLLGSGGLSGLGRDRAEDEVLQTRRGLAGGRPQRLPGCRTRGTARRERLAARRAARAAARELLYAGPVPRMPERVESLQEAGAEVEHPTVAAERLPHPSVPLAPVHPLRPGRVVAARTPAPAGWQNSAVVGLDDDDIGFADIDVYQPRRVANG